MAELGSIKVKVLFQVGDGEPTEVGALLIPVHAGNAKKVGHSVHLDLNIDPAFDPVDVAAKISKLHHALSI